MRLQNVSEPILEMPFLNAGKGPGNFYVDHLPIHIAPVTGMPESLAAIIATADLQGRESFDQARGNPPRLLGESLPYRLAQEILPTLNLRAGRIGVILAGDFYTVPLLDKRGGTGDVTEVWRAFGREFDWVAGVAGNHDQFDEAESPSQSLGRDMHFLDGDSVSTDSLRVHGVSGIIGNPKRHWRRSEDGYLRSIENAVRSKPDLLVLHDGPDRPGGRGAGSPAVRGILESGDSMIVVRGHAHWKDPFVVLSNGVQILNVDSRCVVMVPEE